MSRLKLFAILLLIYGKCYSQGYEWVNIHECSTPFALIEEITSNSHGDLISIGFFQGALMVGDTNISAKSSRDMFLTSHSRDGRLNWIINYPSSGRRSMQIDRNDQIIVGSSFEHDLVLGEDTIQGNHWDDIIIMKLNHQGEPIWSYDFGGAVQDLVYDITVDNHGNIYATGIFQYSINIEGSIITAESCSDVFMLKLDTDGNMSWFKHFPSNMCDSPGMIFYNEDALYLTGMRADTIKIDTVEIISNGHQLLTSFDLDGNLIRWTNDTENAFVVKMIADENYMYGVGSNNISKWTDEGKMLWKSAIGCEIDRNEYKSIALDHEGNIYVSGRESIKNDSDRFDSDLKLVSFNNDGQLVSSLQFDAIDGDRLLDGYTIHINDQNEMFLGADVIRPYGANVDKAAMLKVQLDAFVETPNIMFENDTLNDIFTDCPIDSLIPPIAYNRCGDELTGHTEQLFPIETVGQTILTWIFEDQFGNRTSQDQLITVEKIDNSVYIDSFEIVASATGYSYRWFDCDNDSQIIEGNSQYFRPLETGRYYVEIFNKECSATSECLDFSVLELADIGQDIFVYPNPTNGLVFFESNVHRNFDVQLSDLTGKKIFSRTLKSDEALDLSILSTGSYILNVNIKNKSYSQLIIKR